MPKLLRSRFGAVLVFFVLYLFVTTATRIAILFAAVHQLDLNPVKLVGVFVTGLVFDLAAAAYFSLPLVLLSLLLPQRWLTLRFWRVLVCLGLSLIIAVLLFGAVAEWFFWGEFNSRFNFIAVDYLIYTTEVVGNINESYPMPLIFAGLTVATALGFLGLWKTGWLQCWFASAGEDVWSRKAAVLWLALPLVVHFGLSNRRVPEFGNTYNQEVARNGLYAFGAAFWENSLDYERFYPRLPMEEAFRRTKQMLGQPVESMHSTDVTDITRTVGGGGDERKYNVIQVTVESLSASFLGCFGNSSGLTPVLDQLFEESLVFTNFYATGTRTVRGMEALTLCIPPTPGQSIVRRPHNDSFSVGSLFRARGYDTAFIYSGYGYFDNMNDFFAGNGYRVVDRATVKKEDITYATVWGACDEDLYRWTIRETDAAFAAGKPFHQFVMTTSNHRPFGFPDGKIDLPPGTREAAVKYTDHAIGKLLQTARSKPWFTNTLFIIVGDHCANAAGKTALPITGYHIPAFVWNPGIIPPRKIGALCRSQIDLLPTVFGLMNWTYQSRFFGEDIVAMKPEDERAFISTYQRLGYLRGGRLAVLEPVRRERMFTYGTLDGPVVPAPSDRDFLSQAIAQYQTASWLFAHGLNREDNAN